MLRGTTLSSPSALISIDLVAALHLVALSAAINKMRVAVALCVAIGCGNAFVHKPASRLHYSSAAAAAVEDAAPAEPAPAAVAEPAPAADAADAAADAASLKAEIFAACAASDRGFAASAADRANIEALLEEIAELSPTANATAGLAAGAAGAPLAKCWRLVYTSASDVSTLGANPLAALGGIYQDARDLPVITNVIDLTPRALQNLPPGVAATVGTASRLRVRTRARPRGAARVGLSFERVEVEQLSVLGRKPPDWLPRLGVDLPQLGLDVQRRVFGVSDEAVDPRDADSNPAFFDVTYLDDDFLVIQQGSPGGMFAAIKVDDLAD